MLKILAKMIELSLKSPNICVKIVEILPNLSTCENVVENDEKLIELPSKSSNICVKFVEISLNLCKIGRNVENFV